MQVVKIRQFKPKREQRLDESLLFERTLFVLAPYGVLESFGHKIQSIFSDRKHQARQSLTGLNQIVRI